MGNSPLFQRKLSILVGEVFLGFIIGPKRDKFGLGPHSTCRIALSGRYWWHHLYFQIEASSSLLVSLQVKKDPSQCLFCSIFWCNQSGNDPKPNLATSKLNMKLNFLKTSFFLIGCLLQPCIEEVWQYFLKFGQILAIENIFLSLFI